MARIITKDDEAHPTHPAYKKSHADAEVKAAEAEEKKEVKVPERKTTKTE